MITILVDWSASGWRGVNDTAANRPGWEQPGYDDTSWPLVTLPLSGGAKGCAIHSTYPGVTNWPVNTEYLLRRQIDNAGVAELDVVVDNTVQVWWNGVQRLPETSGYSGDCPDRYDLAPIRLAGGGGVLAVRCRDTGFESYADARVVQAGAVGFQIGRVGIGPGAGIR